MRVPAGATRRPPELRSGKAHLFLGAALEAGQGAGPPRQLALTGPASPGSPPAPAALRAQGASARGARPGLPWARALSVSWEDLARTQAAEQASPRQGRGRGRGRFWAQPALRARAAEPSSEAERTGSGGRLHSAGLQGPSRPRAQRWSLNLLLAGLSARSALDAPLKDRAHTGLGLRQYLFGGD